MTPLAAVREYLPSISVVMCVGHVADSGKKRL